MVAKRDYLPTLDGWRTLSIAAVILFHDKVHHFGWLSSTWLYGHGNLGVDVFFAISGVLICSRLLDEEDSAGKIDLRNFYIRRIFRILPPVIFYLVGIWIMAITLGLPVAKPETLASILFVRNYTSAFSHFQNFNINFPFYTSHFWSLAVEEHFYLILPPLLVFSPKKWRVPSLLIIAVFVAVHRFISESLLSSTHTDMRLDGLLVPAAIAIIIRNKRVKIRLTKWLSCWPILAVALAILVVRGGYPRLQTLALAWLLPFLVLGTMLRPTSLISKFLEISPMRYIGKLSYSIYLWQQVFFITHFGTPVPKMGLVQRWPLCLFATLGCAMFSYYFVERPTISLGRKIIKYLDTVKEKTYLRTTLQTENLQPHP